jgi:hypothetical protein
MRSTFPAHLLILDSIILIIDDDHTVGSSSLCSFFFRPLLASSILGQNIHLGILFSKPCPRSSQFDCIPNANKCAFCNLILNAMPAIYYKGKSYPMLN